MSRSDIWRELYDAAMKQGWTITTTAGQHLRWRSPGGGIVFSPSTPSDYRSFRNVRAQLRRAGLKT